MIFRFWFSLLVSNVIGAVVVHAIKVIASLDKSRFFRCEFRQAITKLLAHRVGVFAKVHWVAKPADCKLDLSVAGFAVLRIFWIPRLRPVAYTTYQYTFFMLRRQTDCCYPRTGSILRGVGPLSYGIREPRAGHLPLSVIPIWPPSLDLKSSR